MEIVRVTDRDRAVLKFAAEHRVLLASHVQALLGVSSAVANARLRALVGAGLLVRRSAVEHPGRCYSVTRRGLDTVGSDLPVPRSDPRGALHDVGLAWLWLAARSGAFGQLRGVVSERRMRSSDAAETHAARTGGGTAEPFAVRLGGVGVGGRERLHYPDLLLLGPRGRVAVELELTPKSRTRRERILAGYGADRRIAGVLYLVDRRSVGRGIDASAERLGVRGRVRVQRVRWGLPRAARDDGTGSARSPRAGVGHIAEAGR